MTFFYFSFVKVTIFTINLIVAVPSLVWN